MAVARGRLNKHQNTKKKRKRKQRCSRPRNQRQAIFQSTNCLSCSRVLETPALTDTKKQHQSVKFSKVDSISTKSVLQGAFVPTFPQPTSSASATSVFDFLYFPWLLQSEKGVLFLVTQNTSCFVATILRHSGGAAMDLCFIYNWFLLAWAPVQMMNFGGLALWFCR